MTTRFFGLALAIGALTLAVGCGGGGETLPPSRLSQAQAEAIARSVLKKEGFSSDRYRSVPSLDTNRGQWVFVFQLKIELRPPGSDLVVWVGETDGKSQFMRGQ